MSPLSQPGADEEFDSKLQWMQVRGEAVVQRNVRLLSAMPDMQRTIREKNMMRSGI